MHIFHVTRDAARHAIQCATTQPTRIHSVAAYLFLLTAIMGSIWTNEANAQDFPTDGPGSWGQFIVSDFPQESTVTVGDVTDDLSIDLAELIDNEEITPEETYSLWQVEPADAARILTPMPSFPSTAPIEIEFLRATTVTVRARGYHDRNVRDPFELGLAANELEFTFNVQSSANATTDGTTDTGNVDTPSELSTNERQVQTATNLLCDAVRANTGAPLSEQERLLASCDNIALLADPVPALDRISAEELFAIGDALTITADNQISNIQSRINTLRARNSEQLDVNSLSIKLRDQGLPGKVLSASKDALLDNYGEGRRYTNAQHDANEYVPDIPTDAEKGAAAVQFSSSNHRGSGASQDVVSDSALGLFASGNLSIGEIDGQGIQRDADVRTDTLTFGADYRLDEHKVVGAALGVVNDNTDFNAENGDMDMQGISLSAFGTWYEEDKGYTDIIIDIARHSFDLSRRINLPGQASEFANGSASANRVAMSVNAGRTFQRGATEFGPVVRIAFTHASIDGFRETSSLANAGNALELDVKSHTVTSLRFSLGAEARHVINTSKAILVPAARVDLEVESDADKGVIAATFVNDPNDNTMNFVGTARDRSAVLLSVGATATFKYGQSAFVFLETRTQDDHVSQSRVRLGYRMHF